MIANPLEDPLLHARLRRMTVGGSGIGGRNGDQPQARKQREYS
jgi:hypothetical protein